MNQALEARGYRPLPSQTNFLFFKAEATLGDRLAEKGILIRTFGGALQ